MIPTTVANSTVGVAIVVATVATAEVVVVEDEGVVAVDLPPVLMMIDVRYSSVVQTFDG